MDALICNQCGCETTDDESEVWVSVSTDGDYTRICHECIAPDEDEFRSERESSEQEDQ